MDAADLKEHILLDRKDDLMMALEGSSIEFGNLTESQIDDKLDRVDIKLNTLSDRIVVLKKQLQKRKREFKSARAKAELKP